MPQEDNGPYTQYVSIYTQGGTVPQFRGMYFPADGSTIFKDTKGVSQTLQNHRAGDYVAICGIEITSSSTTPILLY